MKKDELKYFVKKKVKLITSNRRVYYGTVMSIHDDSLLFRTDAEVSVIKFDFIAKISTKAVSGEWKVV